MAQLLAKLDDLERGRHGPSEHQVAARMDGGGGKPGVCAEDGMRPFPPARNGWETRQKRVHGLTYADNQLLHDVWQQSGSKALTRLLARVMDVVEMASGTRCTATGCGKSGSG